MKQAGSRATSGKEIAETVPSTLPEDSAEELKMDAKKKNEVEKGETKKDDRDQKDAKKRSKQDQEHDGDGDEDDKGKDKDQAAIAMAAKDPTKMCKMIHFPKQS